MRTTPTRLHRRPRRSRRPLRLTLRRPVVYWTLAAGFAFVTAGTLQHRSVDLDRRAQQLGPMVTVAVMTTHLDAGDDVTADDVEMRPLPRRMVPADALRHLRPGRRLTAPVGAGEVLVDARLTPGRRSRLAATVPRGDRAIAIPMPAAALHLTPGDRIDLLALAADGTSTVIVDRGIVLAASSESSTVAVPQESVGLVADAVLAATLTVTLVGGG